MLIKYVTKDVEVEDINKLVDIIKQDKWVDDTTVVVNCAPEVSSILTQTVIHSLSGTDLLYQLQLEMPEEGSNQVWNKETCEYQLFDKYIKIWMNDYIHTDLKFLFLNVKDDFNKILVNLRTKSGINYRTASLYYKDNKPDYTVSHYDGELIFNWQKTKLWQHKHLDKGE